MNRLIIVLLCCLFFPLFSWADACTDSSNYTVDKRCYVEKKENAPYNAVVYLIDVHKNRCSGVVVKYEDKFYLYTAKHCVLNYGNIKKNINVSVPPKLFVLAKQYNVLPYKDLAIYAIKNEDLPYVVIDENFDYSAKDIDVKVVGYGSLKIMSDEEIEDFIRKYVVFLKNVSMSKRGKEDLKEHYIDMTNPDIVQKQLETTGVWYNHPTVQDFLTDLYERDREYYSDIFENTKLQVSRCKHNDTTGKEFCQVWGGNSGGGIFNQNNELVGITTKGSWVIGGANRHARLSEYEKVYKPDYEEEPVLIDLKDFLIYN